MASRTTDEIIESLLADEGVIHPAPQSDADVFAPAPARAEAHAAPQRDRAALADALRAVLDFDE